MDDSWSLVLDELAQDVDAIGDELGIGRVGVDFHFSAAEGNQMKLGHGCSVR